MISEIAGSRTGPHGAVKVSPTASLSTTTQCIGTGGPLEQAGWQLHSVPLGRIPGTVSCPQLDRGLSPQGTACGNNVRSVADNSYPWECLSLPPGALFVLNEMKQNGLQKVPELIMLLRGPSGYNVMLQV